MSQWFGEHMTRRGLLRAIGVCSAAGITGCLSQDEARSITVYNYRDETVTVEMRVVDVGSGDVAIDTEFSIDPDGQKVFGDIFDRDGKKKVTVSVPGVGSEEKTWRASSNPKTSGQLGISISEDIEIREGSG
ncbi:hypothetical protein PNP85_14565 [Halobacterium salinarum]|uniref:hypothetical protein n=1 Tax=Halobacterium salinarum TaxID=2242 RepID=UPI00255347A0|nr:hypothetical protein [Halobacterium salinarum]MDL0140721.1 hypothetical protein [Halobacterium salinarum]